MDEVVLSRIRQEAYEQGYQDGKVDGYNLAGAQMSSAKQERKKGKWFEFESGEDKYDIIKCSCCKHTFTVDSYHWTDIGFVKDDFNYCPNCGAEMERWEDELQRVPDGDH